MVVEVRFNDTVNDISANPTNIALAASNGTLLANATDYNVEAGTRYVQLEFDDMGDDYLDVNHVYFDKTVEVDHSPSSVTTSGDDISNATVRLTTSGIAETAGQNDTAWIGERAALIGAEFDTPIDTFDATGTFVNSIGTGPGSQIALWNSEGKSGKWMFDFGPSDNLGWIELRDLGLTAEAAATDITTDDNIEVTVEANDGDRSMTASLLNADGDVVDSKKFTTDVVENDATVTFSRSAGEEGDYTVEVSDRPTRITAETDTITVSEAPDDSASFTQSDFADNRGDVIEIDIELDATTQATVGLGDYESDGYAFNATVTDVDEDGEVTLLLNTFLSGS